jgi:hypothetical protein
MVQDLNVLLQLATDNDDRGPIFRGLKATEDMVRSLSQETEAIKKKLKYWQEEMELLSSDLSPAPKSHGQEQYS